MKKTVIAMFVAASLAAAADLKVATVNMVHLVELHPTHESNKALVKSTNDDYKAKLDAKQDALTQLNALFEPGFLVTVPVKQLQYYPRFLKAIVMRFDSLNAGAMSRDMAATETVQRYWDVYCKKRESLRFAGQESSDLVQFRWMIEELRVSLFAQKLGTSVPVSEKRLDKLLAKSDS